jgi:hypothetical protein
LVSARITGVNAIDNIILFFLKVTYLWRRVLLRLILGKKRRDRLYVEQGLDFGDFLYKVFETKIQILKIQSAKIQLRILL